jgi:mono/diheme cytochrome c family protein
MKAVLITLGAVALAAALAAAGFIGGLYDISATDQHLRPTYWAIDTASRQSVKLRARAIDVPALDDAARIERGLALYREHCVRCHGAPGVPPESFALGLMPAPANLVDTGRTWAPAEIYWTVRYGFKMTGMPAWHHRMTDEEIWDVVAFVVQLPVLSAADYRKRAASAAPPAKRAEALLPADAKRGAAAMHQYACATCHVIPGIVGASKPVGPPLEGMAARAFVAGVVPNTPENLERFLLDPQAISPESAMPRLGLREQDARDIAAFLLTLR